MPRLGPFVAARPDPERLDVAGFVAPPYDVISAARRKELAARGPSIVELTLPGGEERYAAAAGQLRSWLADGTLTTDRAPALYLYEQTATVEGVDEPVTVRGLIADVDLDEHDGVKPHELVYEKVVGDRLDLLQATGCDLEAIIAIYDGAGGEARGLLSTIQDRDPVVDVTASCCGDRHRLWRIEDPAEIATLSEDLSARRMVIADGHHRWTTARRAGTGSMLMLLQDIGEQAPALLPIHRVLSDRTLDEVIEKVRPYFDVDELAAIPDLDTEPDHVFILLEGDRVVRIAASSTAALMPLMPADASAAKRRLDIAILHEAVFDELLGKAEAGYEHTLEEVRERIAGGGVGILVRPTPLDAVLEVAGNGELMPRKSTFFLPKPISGLVLRPHQANRTG